MNNKSQVHVFSYQDSQQQYSVQVFRFSDSFYCEPASVLSKNEQMMFNQMQNPKRQKQYLESRYWLKQELTKLIGLPANEIEFVVRGEGKPSLKNNLKNIDFSLSHTEDFCAIGITQQGLIGIDIERLREPVNFLQIMKKVFVQKEIDFVLGQADPMLAFVKTWSSKEAVIKAFAGGVFLHCHEIQTNVEKSVFQHLPDSYGRSAEWKLKIFEDIAGHILSIAFKNSI